MSNNYVVGNVTSVNGLKVNILMNEHSNLEAFLYDGKIYDGISVGSYIGIIRGSHKIVGRVEREFLEDKEKDPSIQEFSRERYARNIEVSLIGNINRGSFEFGIKWFPMIFNEAVLLTQDEIKGILQRNASTAKHTIFIGQSVSHRIPVELAWNCLFNTHIGIFGNTGSGKSNTLAKLYSQLFSQEMFDISIDFAGKSKFVVIDFNGEYTRKNVLRSEKKCINLSTRKENGDKLPITPRIFWDIETLSILFSATEKTQRPFLQSAIRFFLDNSTLNITTEKIISGLGSSFYNVFKQNNNKELIGFLRKSLEIVGFDFSHEYHSSDGEMLDTSLLDAMWHSQQNTYYVKKDTNTIYVNSLSNEDILEKRQNLQRVLEGDKFVKRINDLTVTQKLRIAVNSHLIYCLAYGKVLFEHINPLIQRIEARSSFIEKTLCLSANPEDWGVLTVISFRNCNSDAKKMLPLLIAKQLYDKHKEDISETDEISSTVHFIIDEAHNILSEQSTREEESWKDYRLEVFEEIIKEGRKFGFYLTLASQRPSDISPTIISQIHNYFIHRLVNEQDLKMIANTVSSLDAISRSQIPALAPGQCIITGTSFEMPLLIQVDKLPRDKSPNSENADLLSLWR